MESIKAPSKIKDKGWFCVLYQGRVSLSQMKKGDAIIPSSCSTFSQCSSSYAILTNVIKTKKPVVVALSQMDNADDEARKALHSLLGRKDLKASHIPVVS